MRSKRKIALFGLGGLGWIGGSQYITNIIHALNAWKDGPEFEIHLIKNKEQDFSALKDLKDLKIIEHNEEEFFPQWVLSRKIQSFIQRKFLKRINPRIENLLLREQFDFAFPVVSSSCKGKLNSASWIADFQHYYYPKGASEEVTNAAESLLTHIAKDAHKIVLSSKSCEKDCISIYPFSKGRTFAMPFTVYINEAVFNNNDFEKIVLKYNIPRNFLIVSNSFCPTKNHKVLFGALGLLKRQGINIPLICTGNIVDWRNLHFANEILLSINECGIRDQVHLLGIIPRNDQLMLYRMSKAIVQPSLNEGWSTSVEEAKALGKNLVVSDIDVHKEQCSDKQYMFAANDAADLAATISRLWKQEADKTFPDQTAEQSAFEAYKTSVIAFAKRFTEIIDIKQTL